LRQVLINLIGNAIKFTEKGEIRVRTEVESSGTEGVLCHFVVADSGIGIDRDKQGIVFGPFEQADASTTRKYGGTGLGLAISRRLVELMNGKIWVESPWQDESGRSIQGSAFHFTALFEAADGALPASRELAGKLAGVPPAERASPPLRILLAEDNEINQKVARCLLEKHGHSVLVAKNGRDAVAIWEGNRVDLVLMDIQMPEMDGIQATGLIRLRERLSGAHTPIIAMTAHAMAGDRDHCLCAGMDGYVSKPIDPERLFQSIHDLAVRVPAPASPGAPARD
jgi:CheY-like chemotaxis protein